MRKTLILAAATLALAAMAAPAGASAETSHWKMEGVELEENGTVAFTGHFAFTGGWTCETVHVAMELTAGTGTGHVTEFTCTNPVPTETFATVCTAITNVTPEELPWMADDEGTSIRITGIRFTVDLEGGVFCPSTITVSDDTAEGGGLFITPDNTEAMATVALSGSVETSFGTEQLLTELNVTEGSGTYGL